MKVDKVSVSVIVPVYNVVDYLNTCIESILPALKATDEIILSLGHSVDGSTDLSEKLADKYAQIKLIYQNGNGLSNARNCAIAIAEGDYVICVDSDDYVETENFGKVLDRIRSQEICEDVIVNDYYRYDRRTNKRSSYFQIGEIEDQVGIQFLPHIFRKRQCFWNVWRYIYKRSFLRDNGILYKENVLSEDVDYTTGIFLASPSVRFTHSPFYVYTVGRGDSLMDRPTLKRLRDTIEVLKDSIFRLRDSEFEYASEMIAQFQFEYILNLAIPLEMQKCDVESAWRLYGDWQEVLQGSTDYLVVLFTVLLRICGLRLTGALLYRAKQIRRWLRKNKYIGGKI